MDAPDPALRHALTSLGITDLEPTGTEAWRGRDRGGPVRVTRMSPGSRVRLAAARTRADRLLGLRHHALVEVLGSTVVRERVVLTQREVHGTDLATVRRARTAWRAGEVAGLVTDLAEGLAVLHDAGLAHGDIAPANIMISHDGHGVLVDLLGAADAQEIGTPGWAAPERAAGATPAADVHSLGAVAADLLSRCPEVPIALRREVNRCAAVDPAARPTAAELALAVREACPPESIVLHDTPALAGALLQEEVAREDGDRTMRRPLPARGRHRRRGPARGTALLVVVGITVIGLAVGGLRLAYGPTTTAVAETSPDGARAPVVASAPPPTAMSAPVPDRAAAERAARGLTLRRAAALTSGNLPALLSVTEVGSAARYVDQTLWRPGGVGPGHVAVSHARAVEDGPGKWRVALGLVAGTETQDVVLVLGHDGDRWLVRAVEPG